MSRWHLLGIGVAVFGLGYLVCRVGDWIIVSEEERIVAHLEWLTGRARARDLEALLKEVRLAEFGFQARGWGARFSFGTGEEEKLRALAQEWLPRVARPSLRIRAKEDDVQVEDDRARASAELLFEDAGQPYRQPIRVFFRKDAERWWTTELEVLRVDELLRF